MRGDWTPSEKWFSLLPLAIIVTAFIVGLLAAFLTGWF